MLIDNIIALANLENQQYRIFLHKINGELIREITAQCSSPIYNPQLGGTSIFEFSIPSFYDGRPVFNYEDVVRRNLIKVQKGNTPIGTFEIQTCTTTANGISELKKVVAYSLEIKLINKHFAIPIIDGGYKLWDPANPESSILGLVTSKSPSWSVGTIDPELMPKIRVFDEVDTNVYEFLNGSVQETYECIFIYDTVNMKINAKYVPNFGRTSPVIITMDNLIETATVDSNADGLVTRLIIKGQNDLDIRNVNLGRPGIDNFNFFKNTKYMSQSLITALNNYESQTELQKPQYEIKLGELIALSTENITLQSDLVALQTAESAAQKALDYAVAAKDSAQIPILQSQLQIAKDNVIAKQAEVNLKTAQVNSKQNELNLVVSNLSIENYLTQENLIELDKFIIEDSYQDPNIMITESMGYQEVANIQRELLEIGKRALVRASTPRYNISISLADFLTIKEFAPWWNELYIGDIVRVKINDEFDVSIRVTSFTHDPDNHSLTITFGDKYALNDPSITLGELIQSGASAGVTIDYERVKYKKFLSEEGFIKQFMTSSFDLNKNAVIGGTNQEFKVDSSGMLLRRYDSSINDFSPKQIKATHNAIVLTDDKFKTVKVAIGQMADGTMGVAAETLVGKMTLTNYLYVQNDSGTLVIDENGITTQSFSLNMASASNLQKIVIDPSTGFLFQTRPITGSAWVDALKFDVVTKKLKLNGTLEGADGKFTGKLEGGTIGIGGASFDAFTVDSSGNIKVTKGSLNINNKFIVDSLGNMTATDATISGNITLGPGSSINWAQVTPPTAAQVGALPVGTYIPTVPSYITSTKITSTTIESPSISGGTIIGGSIYGGSIYAGNGTGGRIDIANLGNYPYMEFFYGSSTRGFIQAASNYFGMSGNNLRFEGFNTLTLLAATEMLINTPNLYLTNPSAHNIIAKFA